MPTATVTLGRFTLKLSPLPKRELAAARQAGHALEIARLAPVASKEWFKAHSDALRFVFMAAKGEPSRFVACRVGRRSRAAGNRFSVQSTAQICDPGGVGRFGKRVAENRA